VGRHDTSQVRGPAGRRDDDLDAARLGFRGVLGGQCGGAVGGHDLGLVRDAELRQHRVGVAHGLPVGFAAHDDGDEGRAGVRHTLETERCRTLCG
jgi:hypothetical protein